MQESTELIAYSDDQSFSQIQAWLLALEQARARLCLHYAAQLEVVIGQAGFYGYRWTTGHLLIAPLLSGGMVVYSQRYHYYQSDGQFWKVSERLEETILYLTWIEMERASPYISLLYNILHYEYQEVSQGRATPLRLAWITQFLRDGHRTRQLTLAVGLNLADPVIRDQLECEVEIERNSFLRWHERKKIYDRLRGQTWTILSTKRRVHQLNWWRYHFLFFLQTQLVFVKRVGLRPRNNLLGLLDRYTIGVLAWFFRTVKNNLGYSIALAIYGPFTFYFITQPMNPHAMWAVGKVRATYLEGVEEVQSLLGTSRSAPPTLPTAVASEEKRGPPSAPPSVNLQNVVNNKMGMLARQRPYFAQLHLSTQFAAIDKQSWAERMSNFKAMQIFYEENLIFAARMGRLDQVETQLSFPLIAQSLWLESERYIARVKQLQKQSTVSARIKMWAAREELRAQEIQFYLWDKMVRFFFDYKYIMGDASEEQTYKDPYLGQAFIFMERMTQTLVARPHGRELKMPQEFQTIQKLAKEYRQMSRDVRPLRLTNGMDADELRSYMKRQWEILFLLQNKAQEASNFALQTYTWSIRSALWVFQTQMGIKLEELDWVQAHINGQALPAEWSAQQSANQELLDSLYYLLVLEYSSIKKELMSGLPLDIDALQREVLIKNFAESLQDRQQLLLTL